MPTLITPLTPQESIGNRTNKLQQRRDGIELARLLIAAQTDISILQANYNALLVKLDTAALAGMGTTNRATLGSDVPLATSGGTLTNTSNLFLP